MPTMPRLLAKALSRPTAYDHITSRGKPMDRATADALGVVEAKLGYPLTVLQGIGGAAASAGTHLLGRAVDLAPWDYKRKVRALRDAGFAAWYRPALPGVWGAHVHAVLILDSPTNAKGIAASALRQIASYLRGRDGLKGDASDPEPYRPAKPVVFTWPVKAPPAKAARTGITRTRDRLVRMHALADQCGSLLHLSKDPTVVRARKRIAALEAELESILNDMPKK